LGLLADQTASNVDIAGDEDGEGELQVLDHALVKLDQLGGTLPGELLLVFDLLGQNPHPPCRILAPTPGPFAPDINCRATASNGNILAIFV
jgi:hypothetical protein